jgi:hypothetical protein
VYPLSIGESAQQLQLSILYRVVLNHSFPVGNDELSAVDNAAIHHQEAVELQTDRGRGRRGGEMVRKGRQVAYQETQEDW